MAGFKGGLVAQAPTEEAVEVGRFYLTGLFFCLFKIHLSHTVNLISSSVHSGAKSYNILINK